MKPTQAQIERAAGIVNDIAEGIDNNESRKELRESLSIYADLLMESEQKRVAAEGRLRVVKIGHGIVKIGHDIMTDAVKDV